MIRWVWAWECHDNRWELIPSRKFPERKDFQPVCPICAGRPKRHWLRIKKGA